MSLPRRPAPPDLAALLQRITESFPELSPQLQRAAQHLLDAPEDVAISSMRRLAEAARVPPSTLVRLARAAGFASYRELRKVFQDALSGGRGEFASRAQWLQRLPEGGRDSQVVGAMATAILTNVETVLRDNDVATLLAAAELLRNSASVHVVGVGGMHPLASYLHYVARMALPGVRLATPAMASMIDELGELGGEDTVVVLSVSPYATETVRTAEFARRRGASLLAITDQRTAPIAPLATALLLAPTASPQFFPSQVAVIALIETLIALVVSHGDARLLERIARVDELRRREGIYWRERR